MIKISESFAVPWDCLLCRKLTLFYENFPTKIHKGFYGLLFCVRSVIVLCNWLLFLGLLTYYIHLLCVVVIPIETVKFISAFALFYSFIKFGINTVISHRENGISPIHILLVNGLNKIYFILYLLYYSF